MNGRDITALGYREGPIVGLALRVAKRLRKSMRQDEVLDTLKRVLENPEAYAGDPMLGEIAVALMQEKNRPVWIERDAPAPYQIWGEGLEAGALDQMKNAARLPVAVQGALMPDAHHGYGLPIGGVLATENAVIPYGVGVDIGCRMCLSIFDIDPKELMQREQYFTRELNEATLFGSGRVFDVSTPHEVIERKEFDEIGLLKGLQKRAAKQLGSSGSGNHFVEFGMVEINEKDDVLNVEPGKYVGLLSH